MLPKLLILYSVELWNWSRYAINDAHKVHCRSTASACPLLLLLLLPTEQLSCMQLHQRLNVTWSYRLLPGSCVQFLLNTQGYWC